MGPPSGLDYAPQTIVMLFVVVVKVVRVLMVRVVVESEVVAVVELVEMKIEMNVGDMVLLFMVTVVVRLMVVAMLEW